MATSAISLVYLSRSRSIVVRLRCFTALRTVSLTTCLSRYCGSKNRECRLSMHTTERREAFDFVKYLYTTTHASSTEQTLFVQCPHALFVCSSSGGRWGHRWEN